MSKIVLIKLNSAGSDTGPFDVYYDFINLIQSSVSKTSLTTTGITASVPDSANNIRIISNSEYCDNRIDLQIPAVTTSTTTTSTTTTSTTTTSTTTTTTAPPPLIEITSIELLGGGYYNIFYDTTNFTASTVNTSFSLDGVNWTNSSSGGGNPVYRQLYFDPPFYVRIISLSPNNGAEDIYYYDPGNLIKLSVGSDDVNFICNQTEIEYTRVYNGDFQVGMTINVPISGNVDSFKLIEATGDATSHIGKRLTINDDNQLISINDCLPPPTPTLTQTTNFTSGGVRIQSFAVGDNVNIGNRFQLVVYSVSTTVTAVAGDTPESIAIKLRNAINSKTVSQWNAQGSAPIGSSGFPPSATSTGSTVTIELNIENSFFASASVS